MKTLTTLIATCLIPVFAAANAGSPPAGEMHLAQNDVRIDLPAQGLAQAIQSIAQKTNMNILVDPRLVRGKKTQAHSNVPLDKALATVLANTGLTTKVID